MLRVPPLDPSPAEGHPVSIDFADPRNAGARSAGATILQIVPALREDAAARAAVNVAHVLLEAGARAIVAAERRPACPELRSFGGRMGAVRNETRQSAQLVRSNARMLERLIAYERVDIVHAHNAGGGVERARRGGAAGVSGSSPRSRTGRCWATGRRRSISGALVPGDRIIAPSIYAANAGDRALQACRPSASPSFRAASTPLSSIRRP